MKSNNVQKKIGWKRRFLMTGAVLVALLLGLIAIWRSRTDRVIHPSPAGSSPAPSRDLNAKGQAAMAYLEELKQAMLAYRRDVGELPPRGDYCPACMALKDGQTIFKDMNAADPRPHMTKLEQALMQSDGDGWNGPYLKDLIPQDPWGREYTYDDNDSKGANGPGDSFVFSAGPDGVYFNDDDIKVTILTLAESRLALREWRKK